MTGLEIIRAPGTTAEQIVDIVAEHCPPIAPEHCDRLSCRKCWLAWLATGEPPKSADMSTEAIVDLTSLRRNGKAELSGDDPYKPYSKREERLKKDTVPAHLGRDASSQLDF